jgi:hypothetical protein
LEKLLTAENAETSLRPLRNSSLAKAAWSRKLFSAISVLTLRDLCG